MIFFCPQTRGKKKAVLKASQRSALFRSEDRTLLFPFPKTPVHHCTTLCVICVLWFASDLSSRQQFVQIKDSLDRLLRILEFPRGVCWVFSYFYYS